MHPLDRKVGGFQYELPVVEKRKSLVPDGTRTSTAKKF
jgi:hypothetical protein